MKEAKLKRFGVSSSNDVSVIKREIREHGFCILHRGRQSGSYDHWLLQVAETIGRPTTHGDHGPLVWPIRPTGGKASTYSQHSGEADLHTDGQFFIQPPEIIGMICEHQATCGGGATRLLNVSDVLAELTGGGRRDLIDYFSNPTPFRVPEAFATATDQEIVWAPVFANQTIRYRRDTILKAASVLKCNERQAMESRLRSLDAVIQRCRHRRTTLLRHGEIIFIDNRRMLHGRTGFSDPRRTLWRVYLTLN